MASLASIIFPEKQSSSAFDIPTIFGRNHELLASFTIPLFKKTNPNLALVEAILISAASCRVAPTPTAGPLQAVIIGLSDLYILSVKIPPASLL